MKALCITLFILVNAGVACWLLARFWLEAPDDQQRYLHIRGSVFFSTLPESEAHREAVEQIRTHHNVPPLPGRDGLEWIRQSLDDRGRLATVESRIRSIELHGLTAEWLTPPDVIPGRRLLYLHGGGYTAGSAVSHRSIADRLAVMLRAEVLVPDYRLLPEHPRMAGIEDARTAYRWLLERAPDSNQPPSNFLMAGDSAGGNLALVTAAWARDSGLAAADALILFSPQTDATFSAPSHRANLESDVMQGPGLRQAMDAPRPIFLWISFFMNRIPPRSPLVSPLFGDLSGLPPTLIQVSGCEVFLDDAVRYVNKANEQGSSAELQIWRHTLHAWQVLDSPESREALERAVAFVDAVVREEGSE
jgi:acetyl esterase/lipase